MGATPFLICVALETQAKVNFLKQPINFLSCLYFPYITAKRVMLQWNWKLASMTSKHLVAVGAAGRILPMLHPCLEYQNRIKEQYTHPNLHKFGEKNAAERIQLLDPASICCSICLLHCPLLPLNNTMNMKNGAIQHLRLNSTDIHAELNWIGYWTWPSTRKQFVDDTDCISICNRKSERPGKGQYF